MPPDHKKYRRQGIKGRTCKYDHLNPEHISTGMRLHTSEQIYRRLGEAVFEHSCSGRPRRQPGGGSRIAESPAIILFPFIFLWPPLTLQRKTRFIEKLQARPPGRDPH